MTQEELIQRLNDFLAGRKESAGGWAPVEMEEVYELGEIIGGISAPKYEEDPDGDLPIEFVLVDRTRYMSNQFFLVPYFHNPDTDLDVILEIASANVRQAMRIMDLVLRIRESRGRNRQ